MISVYNIKPKFQQLLKPILEKLHQWKITPNAITFSAIFLSIVMGVITWYYPSATLLLIIPAVLFLRMALNALDGMMARTYQLQSPSGEVLNELGDVISDLALFFPLLKLFAVDAYLFLAFLFLAVINEFAGVLGKAVTGTRFYDGPMGKSDRALFIGLTCLLLYFWNGFGSYLNYVFGVAIVLLVISTTIRISKTIRS